MICPWCSKATAGDGSPCRSCGHTPEAENEAASALAWDLNARAGIADAVILGDSSDADFGVLGASLTAHGLRETSLVFYGSSTTTRLLQAGAVPVRCILADATEPVTAFEEVVLQAIDGAKTIEDIRKELHLEPQELVVTLLSLLDDGRIAIEAAGVAQAEEEEEDEEDPATVPVLHAITVPADDDDDLSDALPEIEAEEVPEPAVHYPPVIVAPPEPPKPAPRKSEPPPRPAMPNVGMPAPVPKSTPRPPAMRIDPLMARKAEKLFSQAKADEAAGNLVSARMNLKLALSFDPLNRDYAQALEDLNRAQPRGPEPRAASTAAQKGRELYERAIRAEEAGKIDDAVQLLESALVQAREPAYLNRLGVILAMKRDEHERAKKLIEEAIQLQPGDPVYLHNLAKVQTRAASAAGAQKRRGPPERRFSLFRLLDRMS